MQHSAYKKILLIILDGFGLRSESEFNAVANAKTPNLDFYKQNFGFCAIDASGTAVGLPNNQFGNSEVGHLNIGAGRIVKQDITRIDAAIANGELAKNSTLNNMLATTSSKTLHIMGLLSDGGVHAHIKHIFALIQIANQSPSIDTIWLHVFLDGRDTPPKSAINYLDQLNTLLNDCKKARIATISGRYYAMDRDNRYNRIQLAYDAIVSAKSEITAANAITAVENSYAIEELDEFVKPCIIAGYCGMNNGDSVIFANFRSDRAIELTNAITNSSFSEFSRKPLSLSNYVTMTEYDPKFHLTPLFPAIQVINTLGEYIANQGLTQLRIAETEKYPHVTYFFNGGRKEPFINEKRILINSPRDVKTYDLKPEMSLPEVSQELVAAIKQNCFDFIITNFANCDMVGHSGDFLATVKAVEAVDTAVGKCVSAMQQNGGEVLIIADHGNCEQMFDVAVNQPHTQHTTNLVPCLYIGRPASMISGGSLQDVAPTLLTMAGLAIPPEMTGKCLIKFDK
jgi:2,3-bisphosphoglycerate-independent phosphoglycerate mutase